MIDFLLRGDSIAGKQFAAAEIAQLWDRQRKLHQKIITQSKEERRRRVDEWSTTNELEAGFRAWKSSQVIIVCLLSEKVSVCLFMVSG